MRLKLSLLLTAVASLTITGVAFSGTNAHLSGPLSVKVTITADSARPELVGTVVDRTYRFKPKCRSGACKKVVFKRQDASGRVFSSTLTRTAAGVYDGVEGPYSSAFGCPPDFTTPATAAAHHHVAIVKKKNGDATKIKGHSEYTWTDAGASPCSATQANTFVGR